MGGVDAWFSYPAKLLISLSAPAFDGRIVSNRLVLPMLAVPLPSICLISFLSSSLSRLKAAQASNVGAGSGVAVPSF